MMALRDVTCDEWDAYHWLEVTTYGDPQPVYVRGLKRAGPMPDDGFQYEEYADMQAGEYRWRRVKVSA
jgi:hypothetical protein